MIDGIALAWKQTWNTRSARYASIAVGGTVVLSILGPLLSPHDIAQMDWDRLAVSPELQRAHWFGTDRLGRDLFVRALYGLRLSLIIALLAVVVSVFIGVIWGALAGYRGGRLGEWMMRFVDVLDSLPYLFIIIAFMAWFDRSNVYVLFLAIGCVGWLTLARIVRGQVLTLKQRTFVQAAVVGGVAPARIVMRHIVPNAAGPIIAQVTLMIPQMILLESLLSFLGLGVQEPMSSLGGLLNEGVGEMESAPWLLWVPAGLLTVLLLGLNFIGDGLRDALDPTER